MTPTAGLIAIGLASWFRPISMYDGMRVCASNTIPISTRVVLVNARNGRRSRCVIIGTGPFVRGRILDVSPRVRDDLGFGGITLVRIYARGKVGP